MIAGEGLAISPRALTHDHLIHYAPSVTRSGPARDSRFGAARHGVRGQPEAGIGPRSQRPAISTSVSDIGTPSTPAEERLAGSREWSLRRDANPVARRGQLRQRRQRRVQDARRRLPRRALRPDPKERRWAIWWLDLRNPSRPWIHRSGSFILASDVLPTTLREADRVRFIWSNIARPRIETGLLTDGGKT